MDQTDEQLMVGYQQGEYSAFSELYDRHSARVLGFLRRRVARPEEADELLQSSFLKLHQNRHRYDARYPFLPWLFIITRHTLIDSLRRKVPVPLETGALERLAGSGEQAPEQPLNFATMVTGLPKDQADLIRMRFQEGLSFEEISSRLGLNPPTVRKRLSRSLRWLRGNLPAKGGAE